MRNILINQGRIRAQGRQLVNQLNEGEEVNTRPNMFKLPHKKDVKTVDVFFDMETVFDPACANLLRCYNISWYMNFEDDFEMSEEVFNNMCQTRYGLDTCLDDFMREVVFPCPPEVKLKFIGFNNSNFDNFFLM